MANEHDIDQTERRKSIEERIEGVLAEGLKRKHFVNLIAHLESDDAALIILKGHLVIEERITAVMEKFVFHPEYLDRARLTFAQKVNIARSMSLDESGNSVWEMIEKLNALRNKLSHSLDHAPRANAMQILKAAYIHERGGMLKQDEHDERVWLTGVLAMSLGFVHAFEQEVERFKDFVATMDRAANPHRHRK
jgi:hypothetical protein